MEVYETFFLFCFASDVLDLDLLKVDLPLYCGFYKRNTRRTKIVWISPNFFSLSYFTIIIIISSIIIIIIYVIIFSGGAETFKKLILVDSTQVLRS